MNSIIRLRDFCRAEQQWLVDTIEALVRLESPTTDKAAVDRCGTELRRRLNAIGGRVTTLPSPERGDHVLAEFDGSASGSRPLLLLGHFDTVWPVGQLQRMPLAHVDGRLHGPGVFDMKAGIGVAMLAVRALRETGADRPRIVMLWTSDEEIGSRTSRQAIEDQARNSAAVLVLEPSLPGGVLKTSRKGCGSYEVTIHGRSAHAGIEPEKGANAVVELAHQTLRLNAIQDRDRGFSASVVQVSGGTRPNVIPDEARAIVDVRAATREGMAAIESALRSLTPIDSRTSIEVHGGFERPPLERTDNVVRLFRAAERVAGELGIPMAEGSTGGGSDGNFTAALGVPTLDGLGPIGEGAHALHEHVVVDALPDRATLVAGLLTSI